MGIRPVLIYINANQRAERMRHDLQQAWRLLACGGTLFGAGYHLNRAEIDDFRLKIAENLGSFEAHVVHAPGALKFENISLEYSWESMCSPTQRATSPLGSSIGSSAHVVLSMLLSAAAGDATLVGSCTVECCRVVLTSNLVVVRRSAQCGQWTPRF